MRPSTNCMRPTCERIRGLNTQKFKHTKLNLTFTSIYQLGSFQLIHPISQTDGWILKMCKNSK